MRETPRRKSDGLIIFATVALFAASELNWRRA